MGFESIKNKIKTKLESVSSIQEVQDYPTQEFTGYPVAVVRPASMDADFETTTENKRIYRYIVSLYYEVEEVGLRKARRAIESCVDDIIETLDEDQQLNGIEDSLSSQETMIICYPTISEISDNERYAYAEIELNVVISFSIN